MRRGPRRTPCAPACCTCAWTGRAGRPVEWPAVAALLAETGARLRLDAPGADAVGALGARVRGAGIAAESVAVFSGGQAAVTAARAAFPGARIGAGTPQPFVRLARAEGLGRADFLTSTTPSVVHGADDASVMPGLRGLPSMAETPRARHPGESERHRRPGRPARRAARHGRHAPGRVGPARPARARHVRGGLGARPCRPAERSRCRGDHRDGADRPVRSPVPRRRPVAPPSRVLPAVARGAASSAARRRRLRSGAGGGAGAVGGGTAGNACSPTRPGTSWPSP